MCCFEVCETSKLPLGKVLIVAVRRCHCGVLIRGLRNLGASRKGTFFVLFACTKRTKSTPEVCEPLDSGDDSKLCRKWVCKNFRRLVPKPVLPTKRRGKGFESVRKGYRSADARLMFFEKELLYCKLTVGCRRWNVWLLVSFGVVRSRCRCALKKAFLYRIALHELKNCSFPQTKRFSFAESFMLCSQKPLVFATKTPLVRTLFTVLKSRLFMCKKPFIRTNLSFLLSKVTLFHPPPPIRTTLNLLFAKNAAVLLISALNSYAVKPEPRTDSNHCRRYPENCCFLRCRLPDEYRFF